MGFIHLKKAHQQKYNKDINHTYIWDSSFNLFYVLSIIQILMELWMVEKATGTQKRSALFNSTDKNNLLNLSRFGNGFI